MQSLEIPKAKGQQNSDGSITEKIVEYKLGALKCFIKSVTFTKRENKFFFEDCLKILNLISMAQTTDSLIDELKTNFINIPSEGLIEIIPQLIARLDHQNVKYKDLMKDIIIFIGREHPQTLLFPLIYMKKGYKSKRGSNSLRRMDSGLKIDPKREIAQDIIDSIS